MRETGRHPWETGAMAQLCDAIFALESTDEIERFLRDQPPGAGNEIQLTDAIDRLMQEGKSVQAYRMHGRTFDCGHIEGWLQANTTLAREAGYDV